MEKPRPKHSEKEIEVDTTSDAYKEGVDLARRILAEREQKPKDDGEKSGRVTRRL